MSYAQTPARSRIIDSASRVRFDITAFSRTGDGVYTDWGARKWNGYNGRDACLG